MTGAHLADPLRGKLANQGVGECGIERREPRLGPTRRRRGVIADAREVGGEFADPAEHLEKFILPRAQMRLGGRVGLAIAGRRQRSRIAVGNEKSPLGNPQDGEQSEPQAPTPGPSPGRGGAWRGGSRSAHCRRAERNFSRQ